MTRSVFSRLWWLHCSALQLPQLAAQSVASPGWATRPAPIEFAAAALRTDLESFRSINGVRNSHTVLRAVPSEAGYRMALLLVRTPLHLPPPASSEPPSAERDE